MPLFYPPSSGDGTSIPGPAGPKGEKGDPGTPASTDPSITQFRDLAVTVGPLGVTVRSITMAPNSKLFLQVYAQYTSGSSCGFTTAQNEFIRVTDAASAAGATDVRSVTSIPAFVVLTATATGVDISVKSPSSTPVQYSLRTVADIG